MSLKQPNSAAVWTEPKGTAHPVTVLSLIDDGRGGYTLGELAAGDDPAARLLADARGGFTVHDGASNPSALAELRFIDVGGSGNVSTYE